MGQGLRSAVLVAFLIIIAVFASVPVAAADVQELEVEFVDLTVYRDGLVHVTQTVAVNETVPSFTLQLLSGSVENVLVVDENQTFLDYEITGQNITIYSLGATSVFLDYDTTSLTNKEAEMWTLAFESPYNLTVLLPQDSTVFSFSKMPTTIKTEGGKIRLSLFPDTWEISYVVPIVQPAEFTVSSLNVSPTKVGIGEAVTISVNVTNIGGESGPYTVILKIGQATEDSRTVTLESEESTTVEFKVTKNVPGTYNVEIDNLTGEYTVEFPFLEVAAISAAGIVVLLFFLIRRRGSLNAEKILKSNPYLREEDKEVIMFIAEKGGKAFEAEIRERFPDMPRTSLWRLVKRLEKFDIVKIKRVGLENQVELKK